MNIIEAIEKFYEGKAIIGSREDKTLERFNFSPYFCAWQDFFIPLNDGKFIKGCVDLENKEIIRFHLSDDFYAESIAVSECLCQWNIMDDKIREVIVKLSNKELPNPSDYNLENI